MQKDSVPKIVITIMRALLVVAVLPLAQTAFAQEGKAVKIRIAQAAVASAFAPYWVASERGMFKSNGIDVDLTLLGPAASSQALASDNIEILSASGEGINLRAEGVDVKYFGTVNHVLDFGLYARKGGPSSISAREFEGTSIAVTSPGSATDIFARYILAQYSINPSKLKFLFTQGLPAIHSGLTSGQFDLGGLSVPLSLYAESDKSIHTLIASGQAKVPGTTASLIAKTSWIRSHEMEAKAILRSLSTSVRWMREHSEEAQEIIAAHLKIKEQDTLQKIYSIYTKIWGTPNLEADQAGLKIALMYSPVPKAKTISVDDLIYENNKLARAIP